MRVFPMRMNDSINMYRLFEKHAALFVCRSLDSRNNDYGITRLFVRNRNAPAGVASKRKWCPAQSFTQ